MNLPIPNKQELEKFQELYCVKFGITLSDKEAYEKCLILIQLVYLCGGKDAALHPVCEKK